MESRVTQPFVALTATLAVAAIGLSGCGNDGATAADGPTSVPVATTTPASPTTATSAPLSRFEDRAPVQALRRWAVLMEHAVNRRDTSLHSLAPVATPSGITLLRRVFASDLRHGYTWPGPQPFTPTRVTVSGKTATVSLCLELSGWSQDRRHGRAIHKRAVSPGVFTMVRRGSAWKLDDAATGSFSCSHVKVSESR